MKIIKTAKAVKKNQKNIDYLISVFLLLLFISANAQDTIYLDKNNKKTDRKELAEYYRVISKDPENSKITIVRTFYINGNPKIETRYTDYQSKKKKLVKHEVWYENGQIHIESSYKKGVKDGYFIAYWENGKTKRKDLYKKGTLKEGKCWDVSGNEVPYYDFEIKPEFPGGKAALATFLKVAISQANIPASAKGKKVYVKFYIETDGSVSDAQIVRGIDPATDTEVLRIIRKIPKWKPAAQDGKAVKVRRTLPLTL